MRTFHQIVQSIGVDRVQGHRVALRDGIEVIYHPGGGGFTASLVFEVSSLQSFHLTIFENSWDRTTWITDLGGESIAVGPCCLHMTGTNSGERWFLQYVQGNWILVTDFGETSGKIFTAFRFFFQKIERFFLDH